MIVEKGVPRHFELLSGVRGIANRVEGAAFRVGVDYKFDLRFVGAEEVFGVVHKSVSKERKAREFLWSFEVVGKDFFFFPFFFCFKLSRIFCCIKIPYRPASA